MTGAPAVTVCAGFRCKVIIRTIVDTIGGCVTLVVQYMHECVDQHESGIECRKHNAERNQVIYRMLHPIVRDIVVPRTGCELVFGVAASYSYFDAIGKLPDT